MHSFPPQVLYTVWCSSKLYTNKNVCKNNVFLKEKKTETAQMLMLGLAYLMPDCSLEVSLQLEGPATGQLDQGFPYFSFVPEQILSL
jgi:hypothetical protein